jgi:SEC-C motif-containing protein
MNCPCGSGRDLAGCCQPIIDGTQPAPTAEALMRARYTAYTQASIDFLLSSLHPDHREEHDADSVREWAENSEWHGLQIVDTADGAEDDEAGTVEFVCEYTYDDEERRHHERASFARHDDAWYFVEVEPVRQQPFVREEPKVGRNDPCPCGSGRKYKKCCG